MSFDAHAATSASSSTPASTPSSTPAPSDPTPPTPSTPAPAQPVPAAAEGQPTQYQPNFKFKAYDVEYEIDPMFQGIIKDPDSEKKVKEIFEKAYGIDHLKPKHQALQARYQQAEQFIQSVAPQINEMREAYHRNDLDTMFKILNIPEEKILQHVVNKAQYMELPPEQRQILDEKRAAEQRALQLEKQVGNYQHQLESQVVQAKDYALRVALDRPDYKSIAQAFDERAGKPGAFRDAIIDAGELAWIRSNGKVDLTPEQAIQQVLAYWGNPGRPAEAPIIPASQTPATAQSHPQRPATLPNVTGRQTTSVSKAKPKSIDDLKKLAAQMAG